MNEKDNRRGFSGLSNLTSDTQTIPQAQHHQASPQPSPVQKSEFPLLEMTKWPTLPAPWSSVDSGETWIWGDFFLTFQKKPKTVLDLTMEMQGMKAECGGMTYHYAMSVFYRIDRNPHGPSHRPIMTIALEQADMGMLAKMLGSEAGELLQAEGGSKMGPLMIGLFTGETRLNLGEYGGDTSSQAVKRSFFEILGRQLGVSGQPKMIGNLAQAHGHPETGLPAGEARRSKNKKSLKKREFGGDAGNDTSEARKNVQVKNKQSERLGPDLEGALSGIVKGILLVLLCFAAVIGGLLAFFNIFIVN